MPVERLSAQLVVVRLSDDPKITDDLRALLDITPPCNMVLDFRLVTYLASMHLGQLLTLRKNLHAADRRMALFGLQPAVLKLFHVTSLQLVLQIADDEQAAIASVS